MNFVEIFGVIFGFICVWLTIRENIWCWPVGIVNVSLFLVMFYQAKLYADMGLQAVYIVLSIYGWYQWLHGGVDAGKLPVSRTGRGLLLGLLTLTAAGTLLMGWSLDRWTDADIPYWDSLTTVMSLVAQFLLARKIIENWLFWIGADILFIGIYLYKGLYLTSLLYCLFLGLAITGFMTWKKTMEKEPIRV